MHAGKFLFAQLMAFLPRRDFDRCVSTYRGNYRTRRFSCLDQFLCLAFAQLTYRVSLRDIEICLNSMKAKLYHAGIRGNIARNTLAKANEKRDWRIYADFAHILIARARKLYAGDALAVDLEQTVYAFDSTTIDLCLALFPWARFRRCKAAIKLHTLIDLRGNIPCFIHISCGKMHDVKALDHLPLEPGAFYVMDRGYIDFARLYAFQLNMAFFVTRAKKNLPCRPVERRRVKKATGLRCDQTIVLTGTKTALEYPTHQVCRSGNRQATRFPDQQLRAGRADHRQALQVPLAGRIVLQMDQAALAHQGILWDLRERREDPGLDCDQRLRSGGHRQEGTQAGAEHE